MKSKTTAIMYFFFCAFLLNACTQKATPDRNQKTLESYLSYNTNALATQTFFRPQQAKVWSGKREQHELKEELAQTHKFPPFQWSGLDFIDGEAWYQFEVPDEAIPNGLGGIFITRVYLNVDVYLNNKLIGSGGSMETPIAKNAHRPLYFTIPEDSWKNHNQILIHHKSYPQMGYLIDVLIAEDQTLRPFYESQTFKRQTIPKALFILEIVASLLLFYIWFSQREHTAYLWFSVSMAMLAIFTLNQFLINTYINHKIWLTLNNSALDWWGVSLILFTNQKLKVDKQKYRNALLLYAGLCFLYYMYLPLNQLPGTTFLHAFTMFLMLGNIFYISLKKRNNEAFIYIAFFISILLFALHDILMQSGLWSQEWLNEGFILFYTAPLACLLVFSYLIREFVIAMKASQYHAQNLQMHIDLTRTELEEQYAKLKSIAENKAIENERERIYRDLHDDVGAKLLSLYYRSDNIHSESLAKSALEDLRDIVSRKQFKGENLSTCLIQWKKESQTRIDEYGIQLEWHSHNSNQNIHLNEAQYTHTKRMMRETISNALRHSPNLTKIRIDVFYLKNQLEITIENNGCQIAIHQWQHGRGLNNLSFRAQELNGSIEIKQIDQETVSITWKIPLPI